MQQPLVLLAIGCSLGWIGLVTLESAVTWSSGSSNWSVASGLLGVRASARTWSSATSQFSRTSRHWDVPSADIAASANPLRSVGERSAGNAIAHHARLASEIKAADEKQVLRPELLRVTVPVSCCCFTLWTLTRKRMAEFSHVCSSQRACWCGHQRRRAALSGLGPQTAC